MKLGRKILLRPYEVEYATSLYVLVILCVGMMIILGIREEANAR